MTRLTDDQLNALKDRHPVHDVAGQWVTLRTKRKGQYVGPCPICSDDPQSKTAGRFECDADKWMCAVCADGGDVLALLMKREGLDFVGAIERLGGARQEEITPALAFKRGKSAHRDGVALGDPKAPNSPPEYDCDAALIRAWCDGWEKAAATERYAAFARQRERKRLQGFWNAAAGLDALKWYFDIRGGLIVPDNARLRLHPDMPLFCDGREVEPTVAHRGPAMLAPILDAKGFFAGLHITWLDPHGPKGKARVHHPETGEVLPSKKARGSKNGGYLDLGSGCFDRRSATRMIAGEGIETVLSVYTALIRAGRAIDDTALRSGIDLGNLAGRATETIAHPTLKTEAGRPQRVPGPEPDPASPAMPVPDAITDLVLLGDGDSDPFLTRHALTRASARLTAARPDLRVRVRFAPDGYDFNDLLQRETNT
jgi:hypothetical protein